MTGTLSPLSVLELSKVFIAGQWVEPTCTDSSSVIDPATEQVVAQVPSCDERDVNQAVEAARDAFPSWSALSAAQRAVPLRRLLELMRRDREPLAELIELELGVPRAVGLTDHVDVPIAMLEDAIELAGEQHEERIHNSVVIREPVGVVAAITPWNYPLYQVLAKVAPALAVGCTVVLKPAEMTPLAALRFTQLVQEAGLPAGTFNLVLGQGRVVGEALSAHPEVDFVSFTGSTDVGKRIVVRASESLKRVALELGGKSASVVLPGADLGQAVVATVQNCMTNSGQSCSAWTRLLVPEGLRARAVEIACAAADELAASMGPVASRRQFDTVQGYLQAGIDEGVTVATGGVGRPADRDVGYYVKPTILTDVAPDSALAQEEIFGPVLCVIGYGDEEEAVAIANDSRYGLHGAVWAEDRDTAVAVARRLRTGQVDVNGADFNVHAPFGGFKESGWGRELGRHGLEEYLEVKSIQL